MDKIIEDFIEDFIPEKITQSQKNSIKNELESHIYDRIDYYKKLGYDDEICIDKAFADFCDDEKTKESIQKNLSEIHIHPSLADFFYYAIPVILAIVVVFRLFCHYMFRGIDIICLLIVPSIFWGFIVLLTKLRKINWKLKSVFAFVLVVPYFVFMGMFYFIVEDAKLYIDFNDTKALSSFNELMEYGGDYCFLDEEHSVPIPRDIGTPLDIDWFQVEMESFLDDPVYSTCFLKYCDDEYLEIKEHLIKEVSYMDTYTESEGVTYNCNFSVYGFDFKTVHIPYNEDEWCENDYWFLIGFNDEKCEIAYIDVSPRDFTPSFDEHFIKEDCAWRYFYFLVR